MPEDKRNSPVIAGIFAIVLSFVQGSTFADLHALAAGGQAGVERALGSMRAELIRGMKLMGCTAIDQLSRRKSAVQVAA